MSPLLFLVAFDDIFDDLEKIGVDCFGYCDDLSITGETMEQLKAAIKICEEWTIRNKMKINKLKSGIILHKKDNGKRKAKKKDELKEYESIPIVKKYRYLGIDINEQVDCKDINE